MKTWLCQGDSVTDCGRNRSIRDSLGNGYVSLLEKHLKQVQIVNLGVSGERTHDLIMRWTDDLLSIRPNILTVLIGINNIWHQYLLNRPAYLFEFDHHLRWMLNEVKRHMPECQVLLMTPFLLNCGVVQPPWFNELDHQIGVLNSIAKDYNLPILNLQNLFKNINITPALIAEDGVHPTLLGHQLIADAIVTITRDWQD
jgi:lysophospholipase L1-like esterase